MNADDFIRRARDVHGDRYDYSKVEYKNTDTKVCIICPEHGEFWQTPYKHLHGQGCPKCCGMNWTQSDLIKAFRQVHGDKYDYSKVVFTRKKDKVCIICPEHGEFWQTPINHLSGKKCPFCSKIKMTKEYFIRRAREVHGDRYDYSKVEYKNTDTKVCIICPEHGEFWQTTYNHIKGHGCPYCGHNIITDKETFIKQAREVHGDRYDYSKVEFKDKGTKVCIICPEHGEFWQRPSDHLRGNGCPSCWLVKRSQKRVLPIDEYTKRAAEIHKNKYDYSLVTYSNLKDKVNIICNKHGVFSQEAFSHLSGCGCPSCSYQQSKNENELFEYIKSYLPDTIHNDRKTITPLELDIVIPSKKCALEYNGLLLHSEYFGKTSTYHLEKLEQCKKKGIKLIQVFEDEYVNNKTLVLNKINHLLNISNKLPKIYGRKCIINEIDFKTAKFFLNQFHIQGGVPSTVYLGAFYNGLLIGVMTFKKISQNIDDWELNRFATDYNFICSGIGGKLFQHFIRTFNPQNVKSFADRRWTINEDNNLYIKLGFEKEKYIKPDYKYFRKSSGIKRIHKFNCRKKTLKKLYPNLKGKTESEMTMELGYKKIYDCGLIKYVWHRDN